MILPRPYPDELIGSLLIRSSRRLGLSVEKLVEIARLGPPGRPSFVVPGHLSRLATQTHMDPEDLLVNHTLFRYVAIPFPPQKIAELRDAAISGDPLNVAAIYRAQFPSHAAPTLLRRFCRTCLARDKEVFGESFWHRTHAIPGVLTCPEHGIRLVAASAALFHGVGLSESYMPMDVDPERPSWHAPRVILRDISVAAIEPLTLEPGTWFSCSREYAAVAASRGYQCLDLPHTAKRLVEDCQSAFGKELLVALDLSLSKPASTTWVIRVIRGLPDPRQETLAHVLLRRFLRLS